VRTATVDVQSSPDGKEYTITVVSPTFENVPPFKRRDLVTKSLGSLRIECPAFTSCQVIQLNLFSPLEMTSLQRD
jgi:hypothetical protein